MNRESLHHVSDIEQLEPGRTGHLKTEQIFTLWSFCFVCCFLSDLVLSKSFLNLTDTDTANLHFQ